MKTCSLFLFVLTLALVPVVALGWQEPDQQAPDWGEGGFHRSIHWHNPSGEQTLSGLFLFEAIRVGAVTRALIEDAVERPVILTHTMDAHRGRHSIELLDDGTGWWARIDIDTGVTAEYLGAYFRVVGETLRAEHRPVLGYTFTTRDGLVFERDLPLVSSRSMSYQEFADALHEAGLADQLLAGLPAGLSDSIRFLDAFMSPELGSQEGSSANDAYILRGVIEVLVNVAGSEPAEPSGGEGEPWVMTVGEIRNGIGVVDPDLLELVSRFRSMDNADPLSDHRARDVLSQDPDTNP